MEHLNDVWKDGVVPFSMKLVALQSDRRNLFIGDKLPRQTGFGHLASMPA
jgi:hypothetical protein